MYIISIYTKIVRRKNTQAETEVKVSEGLPWWRSG